jgi:hypothetical protein
VTDQTSNVTEWLRSPPGYVTSRSNHWSPASLSAQTPAGGPQPRIAMRLDSQVISDPSPCLSDGVA